MSAPPNKSGLGSDISEQRTHLPNGSWRRSGNLSSYRIHLNNRGKWLVARLILERMKALGWTE
jgi:hypothetical protein